MSVMSPTDDKLTLHTPVTSPHKSAAYFLTVCLSPEMMNVGGSNPAKVRISVKEKIWPGVVLATSHLRVKDLFYTSDKFGMEFRLGWAGGFWQ